MEKSLTSPHRSAASLRIPYMAASCRAVSAVFHGVLSRGRPASHTLPFVVLSSEIYTLGVSFFLIPSNGARNAAVHLHRITNSPWRFRRLRLFSIPFTKCAEEPNNRVHLKAATQCGIKTAGSTKATAYRTLWPKRSRCSSQCLRALVTVRRVVCY